MKKTLALSFLFVFVMALATPVMADTYTQEPVKTEKKVEKKKKADCPEDCKKECCEKKSKECCKKKAKK